MDEVDRSSGSDLPPSGRGGAPPPVGRRAWLTVGALVAVFAVVLGVTLATSPIVAPSSSHSLAIVSDPQVQIAGGVDNGVVFGFQPAASPASDDPMVPGIVHATLIGSLSATGCGGAVACPTAVVEILTNDELSHLQATGTSASVWCYQAGVQCTATSSAQFTVDVTHYTATPLALVIWNPANSGSGIFSLSATLTWQTS